MIAIACGAFVFLSAGCGGNVQPDAASGADTADTAAAVRNAKASVLVPEAPGTETLGNEKVTIDVSNVAQGYASVTYTGDNDQVKLQISCDGGEKYTYNLQKGVADVFPLTQGNGKYRFEVLENISGDQYQQLFTGEKDVQLESEFLPFLYPNQYVKFLSQSVAVAQGEQLAQGAADDLALVEKIYNYVVENVSYDYEKADTVESGYLPDVDDTLQTKKGICFDYAALMTAMLRSQRIPTRLVIGYVGELYHAWISVYIEGEGWIDNIIYFDGTQWTRMDPTLASTNGQAKEYTGDGNEYHEMYTY